MPPSIRQTNFGAGELAPLLWGRTDLPQYGRGARAMRNFVPTRHGAAMSRPGTTFVDNVKETFLDGSGAEIAGVINRPRLLPFNAGDGQYQSYGLEFGAGYIRFVTSNARVLDGAGNPYEVSTPYSSDDVWQLQYAQLGDVLVLVCPNWDPLELRRIGHTTWSLTPFRFAAYSPYASDVEDPTQATTGFVMVIPDAWQKGHNYKVGDRVVADDGWQARLYECIKAGTSDAANAPSGTVNPVDDGSASWKFVQQMDADSDHPAREWQYLWTAVVKDKVSGAKYETLGEMVSERFNGGNYDATARPLGDDKLAVYTDMPVTLRRADTAGLLTVPEGFDTYVVEEYLVYRGAGGLFGFLGSTKGREFVDLGLEPNYAIQPPVGDQPFGTATEPTGAAPPFDTRRLDRPSAVAFFQQKLVFGGPTRFPGDLWASKTNDFQNWDERLYYDVAGEALHFELAARRREAIRSFGVLGRLIPLTDASVWSVAGNQAPLDFDSVEVRVEEEIGATTLPPLVVNGALLYARAKGRGVRALVPQDQFSPLAGVDVSELAQHLFTGQNKTLVDWCFQEDPFGIVWAVRKDGALLSLTYMRDAWGWARHDTDGVIESVCSVPEGSEDAVYLVVARTLEDGTTHRYIERMTSRVQYDGPTFNPDGSVDVGPDFICVDSGLRYFDAPVQVIGGLEHLEGKKVWVIGPNMDPLGDFTVTGGEIDLGDVPDANVTTPIGKKLLVYVGLLFTPELETLDVAGGDARLKKKTVERIGFEADQSIGLRVGQSLDDLDDWIQRDVEDGFNPVSAATVLVDMPVESTWDQSARGALQQAMPLPITLVGITRELALGD